MSVTIRKVTQNDFEAWAKLYQGYADFYQVPMNDEILNNVWTWIFDSNTSFYCLVAELDTKLVGFMHYRAMPSSLRGIMVGFLDDLFVMPEARGTGVVDKLFDGLKDQAEQNSWPLVRWITAEDNYRGRAYYDKMSQKTKWVTYQLDI
ncbi:GNAT family N-acetyltransferase [Francisellaceae bacterium]|nr:GNAT family N-acetyltransferase [Francisellaceae bacterium]